MARVTRDMDQISISIGGRVTRDYRFDRNTTDGGQKEGKFYHVTPRSQVGIIGDCPAQMGPGKRSYSNSASLTHLRFIDRFDNGGAYGSQGFHLLTASIMYGSWGPVRGDSKAAMSSTHSACPRDCVSLVLDESQFIACLNIVSALTSLTIDTGHDSYQFLQALGSNPPLLPQLRTLTISARYRKFDYFAFIHLLQLRRDTVRSLVLLESAQLSLKRPIRTMRISILVGPGVDLGGIFPACRAGLEVEGDFKSG
ncbi:hypothetical protein DFH06DRAFT_1130017 [Mycena polygramma]|nr:hypothetical protein DFH06DRAFT_1130017 [Mycena polygramma]